MFYKFSDYLLDIAPLYILILHYVSPTANVSSCWMWRPWQAVDCIDLMSPTQT